MSIDINNTMLKHRQILIMIFLFVIIASMFYTYEAFLDTDVIVPSVLMREEAAEQINDLQNTFCTLPTKDGQLFEFRAGDAPLDWFADPLLPNRCRLDFSGDDIANTPLNCSKKNPSLYDKNVVEDVKANDALDGVKRCYVDFKQGLTKEQLTKYVSNLRSYKNITECKKATARAGELENQKIKLLKEAEKQKKAEASAQATADKMIQSANASQKKFEAATTAANNAKKERESQEEAARKAAAAKQKALDEAAAMKAELHNVENMYDKELKQQRLTAKENEIAALAELEREKTVNAKNAAEIEESTKELARKSAAEAQQKLDLANAAKAERDAAATRAENALRAAENAEIEQKKLEQESKTQKELIELESKANKLNNVEKQCRTISTPQNDPGGGQIQFMDRHLVGCDDNEALTGFQMQRNPSNGNIYYNYRCCKIPPTIDNTVNGLNYNKNRTETTTPWSSLGHWMDVDGLTKQDTACTNSYISSFRLEPRYWYETSNPLGVHYKYVCNKPEMTGLNTTMSCFDRQTSSVPKGKKNWDLSQMSVMCPDNAALTQFKLEENPDDRSKHRYAYRCCEYSFAK